MQQLLGLNYFQDSFFVSCKHTCHGFYNKYKIQRWEAGCFISPAYITVIRALWFSQLMGQDSVDCHIRILNTRRNWIINGRGQARHAHFHLLDFYLCAAVALGIGSRMIDIYGERGDIIKGANCLELTTRQWILVHLADHDDSVALALPFCRGHKIFVRISLKKKTCGFSQENKNTKKWQMSDPLNLTSLKTNILKWNFLLATIYLLHLHLKDKHASKHWAKFCVKGVHLFVSFDAFPVSVVILMSHLSSIGSSIWYNHACKKSRSILFFRSIEWEIRLFVYYSEEAKIETGRTGRLIMLRK